MKFTSALVIALAGVVVAKGNKNSTESQCAQVQKLTKLTEIAANQTLLEKASKDNATKAAEIQAKAATAATTLATLQSNTTLMTACDSIFAAEDTLDQCDEMASLEKVMEIANNQTLLDKATKNNATKAAAYQAKASAKAQTLADLQSNTTLTAACAVVNDKASCKTMAKLAKEQAMASNTTALNAKFNNDATKVSNYQAKVSEKAQKLATLTSNTTLADTCSSLGIDITSAAANTTADSTTTTSSKTSAAVGSKAMAGGQVFALVSVFAYAIAML